MKIKNNEKCRLERKIVKNMCDLYLNNCSNVDQFLKKVIYCSYSEKDIRSENTLEAILWVLDYESRFLIVNEFILKEGKKWYSDFWSIRKYYNLKRKAIKDFVYILNKGGQNVWFACFE